MKRSRQRKRPRLPCCDTGAFALRSIADRGRDRRRAVRQSILSIEKFGFEFWRTDAGIRSPDEFGALPFIWGTLYSSVLALLIATPIALGIAIFLSELCPPAAADSRWCS